MTREEAIMILKNEQPHCGKRALFPEEKKYEAYDVAIKALEQQTCEDCISREAVLENIKGLKKSPWFNDDVPGVRIVRKEAVEIIEDLCIKNLPSVNHAEKQELCEDAISRQAALDIFADNADVTRPYSIAWEEVKALPSVNPQRTGHWIQTQEKDDAEPFILWECSCCHKEFRSVVHKVSNYCPSCGCRIVEPQESEVVRDI